MKLRTKLTVMLLALLVLLGAANVALAAKEGDFEYRIENGGAILTKYTGQATELAIPATLGGKPVTTLGNYSFMRCSSLTSIVIPDSVTTIGAEVFSACTSLTSIVIPDSVTSIGKFAFAGCTSLTSIVIPDSVTSIGAQAFERCDSLITITIPDSVTFIGSNLFYQTTNLRRGIASSAIAGKIRWPAGTLVGYFDGDFCYRVADGQAALWGYDGQAAELTIPSTLGGLPVTTISASAFRDHTALTSVTIPDSVTAIGNLTFCGCTGLTGIVIPESVTSIGKDAFKGCTSLTTVISNAAAAKNYSFGSGVRVGLFEGDFEYTISGGQATLEEYTGSAEELTIPATLGRYPVTVIGDGAFRGCTGLASITIPASVTTIGNEAFYGCTGLTSISIPDSVTAIGDGAFRGCSGLTGVTIPASVTTIGSEAFYGCSSLTTITIPDSVTRIGEDAFSGCTSLTAVNTSCTAAQSYAWPAGVRVGLGDDVFSFVPVNSRSYCLMSYSGDAAAVVVPSTYNGKPVSKIDSEAFSKSVTLFVTGQTQFVATNPCWRYTVNADGTLCLTGTNITDSRLILPAEACGTPVTAIGDYAFDRMALSFVHIPDSIVAVGGNPFRNCMSLTTIVVNPENPGLYVSADGALYSKADKLLVCFPAGLTADKLTIPEGVRSIGAYALYWVQAAEIVLPDSLTDIGMYAFAENLSLQRIALPDGITEIPAYAFADCPALGEIIFPAALTGIGANAFSGCNGLAYLTFPATLTSIGAYAFYDCNGLLGVSMTEGVQSIGEYAFSACEELQLAAIPASATVIGANAFSGAPLLTLQVQPGSPAAAYARENLLHALYPDSDSWLSE